MRLQKEHHNDIILWQDFGICKGYGCRDYLKTGLSEGEWEQIKQIFVISPENAEEERSLIKKAIALFEVFIGPKTGTSGDDAGAQIINFSAQDQMDCIDETFNTSTYLHLLRKSGLIKFHKIGKPLHRGNYITRWPHNTATIHEEGIGILVNSKGHFVVDSWFHANGEEPEIIPAALWSSGWSPKKK